MGLWGEKHGEDGDNYITSNFILAHSSRSRFFIILL
jgi:hypothetical protein